MSKKQTDETATEAAIVGNTVLVAGVVLIKGDTITIQPANYIEDGWYIEIVHNEITLYEIPQFGGKPIRISGHNTLMGAIEAANRLT
jgi:hypothetical protein